MMLLLIVRSNIPQLISQLKFVEIFSFKRNPHLGQLGFTLSSFEAVLSYICSAGSLTDLMKTSDRNVRLWECIASQAAVEAIDKLTEILGNANSVNSCSALANSHPPKSPISAFPHHSLLDILTEAGDNCLMVAVRSGQIEMISYLLEVHSFSIQNSVNFSGQTVLHVAVEEKLPHIVRFLLGYCGDVKRLVDFVDRQGQTALHIACVHANVEIINSLLSANASCNLRDNLGNLPVFIYARTHISLINRDVFKLLLEPLTLEVARNNAGETIFHILKDREIAELAAKTIGDINTSKSLRSIDLSTGCTPLHRACICDAVGMIDYLLGNNSINSQLFAAVDKFSDTCIHVATKAGAFAALERLLGCTNLTRSMIDQRNDCGETALHLAAKSDRSDLIAALLEAGVNGSAAQVCLLSILLMDNY
jgi:ankyrin repeat protein